MVIIGDAAYPNYPWLIKPFPGRNLNARETNFNFVHSSTRMIIEQAFGLLKARWRILLKRQDTQFENMHYVISACFILHNICLNNKDDFLFESLENETLDIEINNTNNPNNGNLMRDYLSHLL